MQFMPSIFPRCAQRRIMFRVLTLLLAVCISSTSNGEEAGIEPANASFVKSKATSPLDEWTFGAEVYLWGASLSGSTITGDAVETDFGTILSDLNLGFMGVVEAQRDRFALYADLIYLNLDDKQQTTANIVGFPITVATKVDLQGVISTFGGGYRFIDEEQAKVEGLVGGRVLWLDGDLRFDVGNRRLRASDSSTNVDAIIGLRGQFELADDWYALAYGDVGTGQSDLTWQAWGSLNYRWDTVTLSAGYRYQAWEFKSDADLFGDLALHGPVLGVKFQF